MNDFDTDNTKSVPGLCASQFSLSYLPQYLTVFPDNKFAGIREEIIMQRRLEGSN